MLYYKPFSLHSPSSCDLLSLSPVWFQVSVHLEASPAFQAVPVEKGEDSYCICENGRQTVSWAVTPKSLGKRHILRNYSIVLQVSIAVGFLYPVPLLSGKDAFLPDGIIFFFVSYSKVSRRIFLFPSPPYHLGYSVSLFSNLCHFHF